MNSCEKVAYIKGLMEGLSLDENSKETKVLKAIVDVLEDIALTLADVEDEVAVIDDDCSELFDMVDELSDEIYGDGYDFEEDEDDGLYELICPECGNRICVDGDAFFDGEAVCPECGAQIQAPDCDLDCENCDGCEPEDE